MVSVSETYMKTSEDIKNVVESFEIVAVNVNQAMDEINQTMEEVSHNTIGLVNSATQISHNMSDIEAENKKMLDYTKKNKHDADVLVDVTRKFTI